MIKNLTRLAYEIGDKVFHLYCEQNSTTAELKEIAAQIIAHMVEIEKQMSVAKEESRPAEEQPKED